MRLNKFIASRSGLSRRAADGAIMQGRVTLNGAPAQPGDQVMASDIVALDGAPLGKAVKLTTIMLHKPVGYVCSRDGQGSATIYELLPPELLHLNPVGRLDKQSSGLLLLTNDGDLANQLTHPRFAKDKLYEVTLQQPLDNADEQTIADTGVSLDDGPSTLDLIPLDASRQRWQVTMHEGRNRQIRRTFAALGYKVLSLHRTQFGPYQLATLPEGAHVEIKT